MFLRPFTRVLVALLLAFSGCNGMPTSDSTTLPETDAPANTTQETTTDSSGEEPPEYVLVIDSNAEEPVNVSLYIDAIGGESENRSFVMQPGKTHAVKKDVEEYRVSVVIDGRTVVNNTVVPQYKQIYIDIRQDGSIVTRTITV